VTIGFGLRNVTDKARAALDARVLKPGGQLLIWSSRSRSCPD
jgi:ubiquinone/menaquinone biosynthesis C-methylase UbiE